MVMGAGFVLEVVMTALLGLLLLAGSAGVRVHILLRRARSRALRVLRAA